MNADFINGAFELVGAGATGFHIRALLRDKQVRGFKPSVFGYYTAWGLWNLFYYPYLHQWFSFTGGAIIVATNLFYTSLALYYTFQERKQNGNRNA